MILYTQHLINKKIFDFAIQLSLDEIVNTPLYANYNLLTEKEPRLYGVMSPVGLKFVAKIILDTLL